jgi:glucosamine 6-phosphate synthetase-like amidotransferase/phosphosugar isomerase protein
VRRDPAPPGPPLLAGGVPPLDKAGAFDVGSVVRIESGLPEELTPLTLAVLGQLLAHRVALARGIDPDRPRALNKVTRTW